MEGKAQDATVAELASALGQPGCAVCQLTHRAVGRFLRSVAYEQVNDLALRADLRATRGFCTTHAHRWLRDARSVLGTAIIYQDALTAALRELSEPAPDRGGLRGLFGQRQPPQQRTSACVACRAEQEAQDRFIDALLESLGADSSVAAALDASDGLCLPHTRRALERGGRRAEPVRRRAEQVAARLVDELREVIRKEDYRFRHEPRSETDRKAPRSAIDWAGPPGRAQTRSYTSGLTNAGSG